MKKIFGLILVLAMLLCTPGAFSQDDSERTLSMMGYEQADTGRYWSDNLFFERMAELTGIRFTFEQYDDLDKYQARLTGLSPQDASLPEVLFKARLDPVSAQELYRRGVLIDLAPYLAQHAPHFYALMQADPSIRDAITLPDGVIAALPFVNRTPGQNILWINKEWLDNLKLSMPVTIEDLEAVLTAFKTRDPNRNGRNDEVPLSFIGPYDLKYLAHAWGLIANDYNIFVREGTVQFMPSQPSFREFLRWSRRMYANELFDRDAFTTVDALRRQTDAKGTNRYGAFFAPLPTNVVPMEWSSQYQAMMPLMYEGRQVYRQVASPVFYGTFALTSACTDIPGMLSWVDALYTPQGAILAGIGLEDEDFVMDGDGSWRLLHEAGDRTYLARSIIASDQSTPGITNDEFQMNYNDPNVRIFTRQIRQVADIATLPFPDRLLSAAEHERVLPLQMKLARFVDESIARFVLGEWDVSDEQLDAFDAQLRELGLEEFLAFWQEIYDKGAYQ